MKKLLTALAMSALFVFEPANAASSAKALVVAYARAYGVPVDFALRVARKESGIRCGVGRKYAGPLQISFRTARSLGFRGTPRQLHACENGTKYGMIHLAKALRLAGGNQRCALRKHQGGLGVLCGRKSK